MIDIALNVASRYHAGAVDKAGVDYIKHPLHVSDAVKHLGEEYAIVALLHDVVEDTECSLSDLKALGFAPKIIDAVDAITKRDGEDYSDYLARVKANDIARVVKLADIAHNSDASRLPEELRSGHEKYARKYAKAIEVLTA